MLRNARVSRENFAGLIESAPLGVYWPDSDSFRIIPAAMEPLIVEPEEWDALAQDSSLILQAMDKVISWLRKPEQGQRAELLFSELTDIEWDAAWGLLQKVNGLAAVRLDLFLDVGLERRLDLPSLASD